MICKQSENESFWKDFLHTHKIRIRIQNFQWIESKWIVRTFNSFTWCVCVHIWICWLPFFLLPLLYFSFYNIVAFSLTFSTASTLNQQRSRVRIQMQCKQRAIVIYKLYKFIKHSNWLTEQQRKKSTDFQIDWRRTAFAYERNRWTRMNKKFELFRMVHT